MDRVLPGKRSKRVTSGFSRWHPEEYDKMTMKNYSILCAAITVTVVLSVLYIPGLSDAIEQVMLVFLATNAR
jgi:hypothetical protein